MKMPDPIIEPMTIIVASIGPSARTRLDLSALIVDLFVHSEVESILSVIEAKLTNISWLFSRPRRESDLEILRFAQNDNAFVTANSSAR